MEIRFKLLDLWSLWITYSHSYWKSISGSITAIRGLVFSLFMRDSSPDRCLVTPALLYRGSHPSLYEKSLGLQSARWPFCSRYGTQCLPMMEGGRDSSAALLNAKMGEESMSCQEGLVSASKLRILALTSWTAVESLP